MKKIIILLALSTSLFFIGCNNENSPTDPFTDSGNSSTSSSVESLGKSNRYAEYEITIENLTPATGHGSSQPLSPPVIASHRRGFHVFQVNKYASTELGQLAEDAVNMPLIHKLKNSSDVYMVVEGSGGPIFPGTSQTFTIKTKLPFKKLSLASMLVNTNDAFTGIDAIPLPIRGTREAYLKAYDAGTEKNTEMSSHIPGPCCGSPLVRVPTHEKISYHEGIKGKADLDPEIFGWGKYVAKLSITRIN